MPGRLVYSRPEYDDLEGTESGPCLDALIVGAGWAGLWTLHCLREKGFRVLLAESNGDVGGVWQYTKYPGCRNETEAPVYQFSAEVTWEKWNWTERYPKQTELLSYLQHVADRLHLREDIVFNCKVTHARWIESVRMWDVTLANGITVRSQFFIPCTGDMTKKYIPRFPGLSSFKHAYHTSEWPEGLDLTDKRVGVIGTGSSGTQVIETIGPSVKHLTVFQRTPNLTNPRYQQKLSPSAAACEAQEYTRRFKRMQKSQNGLEFDCIDRNTLDDTPEQRQAVFETLWARGAQHFWLGNYNDLLTNKQANEEAHAFWCSKVRPRINNPTRRDILAPLVSPHAFGTKRPSLESSYFEVFNQSNVDLIDLKADSIEQITSQGVLTSSGVHHDLDVLVLATGFDCSIGSILSMDIRGRSGLSLRDKWTAHRDRVVDDRRGSSAETSTPNSQGVLTYLGLCTSGFPNMFLPAGPQSPIAFGVTPRLAEQQAEWVAETLVGVVDEGRATIEATEDAEQGWKNEVLCKVEDTLIKETNGWYMSCNIPGRKKEPLFYFGGLPEYMKRCWEAKVQGYRGFVLG